MSATLRARGAMASYGSAGPDGSGFSRGGAQKGDHHSQLPPSLGRQPKDYIDRMLLSDGTDLRIRPVRPEDKRLFLEAFEKLSFESRLYRFLQAKPRLPESELRYFTEIDGWNHHAIGAFSIQDGEEVELVGIARFVRMKDRSDAAELAVTVADELQGRGLGKCLVRDLIQAGAERGLRRFVCILLAENVGMKALLAAVAPGGKWRPEGSVLTYEFSIPEWATRSCTPVRRESSLGPTTGR